MRQAIVLRLLRDDARKWWWFAQLRKQGRISEASKLERESIRGKVKDIRRYRELLEDIHIRTNTLTFHTDSSDSYCVSMSGCHDGFFAAFIYCYANRIGKSKA